MIVDTGRQPIGVFDRGSSLRDGIDLELEPLRIF